MTVKNGSQAEDSEGISRHPNAPPARILVVDDEAELRRLCSEALTRLGYHVDAVEDGAAAWDVLQTKSYDLLLTDHKMSRLTGVELMMKLQAARKVLPVILMSSLMPTDELARHPGLRLDATLEKPFTVAQLLKTTTKVLYANSTPQREVTPQTVSQTQLPLNDLRA